MAVKPAVTINGELTLRGVTLEAATTILVFPALTMIGGFSA